MASILNLPHFQDPDKAREYLEALRWANGVACPHCGSLGKHLTLAGSKNYRPGLRKCADCYEQFTVTVGTVFERSKIGLHIWLQAVHWMCASKKGISAKQLERMLGVTYKTAWFMAHRIREAMKTNPDGLLGSGGGTVEADETYWGNMPRSKVAKLEAKNKPHGHLSGGWHKEKIVSLVERGGNVRTEHVRVRMLNKETLKEILDRNVSKDAHLMTDESKLYNKLGKEYASHQTVNHKNGEYSREGVTTNTVEGYFSILKRGLVGTFHSVGEQHMQRYCTEFDFRYNTRISLGVDDVQRFNIALKGIEGKRLTYRRLDGQQAAQI